MPLKESKLVLHYMTRYSTISPEFSHILWAIV